MKMKKLNLVMVAIFVIAMANLSFKLLAGRGNWFDLTLFLLDIPCLIWWLEGLYYYPQLVPVEPAKPKVTKSAEKRIATAMDSLRDAGWGVMAVTPWDAKFNPPAYVQYISDFGTTQQSKVVTGTRPIQLFWKLDSNTGEVLDIQGRMLSITPTEHGESHTSEPLAQSIIDEAITCYNKALAANK